MEMPKTKFEAMCREFPFVRNHAFYNLKNILISRADGSLLEQQGRKYIPDGRSFSKGKLAYFIFLLDKNGEIICEVGASNNNKVWWKFWTWSNEIEKETVEEAICRIGSEEAKKAYYVLSRDHDNKVITIYKPPKNIPLVDAIERSIQTEQTKIKEQLISIDNIA